MAQNTSTSVMQRRSEPHDSLIAKAKKRTIQQNALRAHYNRLLKEDGIDARFADDLPDPRALAFSMSTSMIRGMLGARRGTRGPAADCYRVPDECIGVLRRLGLVEMGGPCLTAFGIQVRRELVIEGKN